MERSQTAGAGRNGLVWAGMALIIIVGLIHLVEAPEYLEEVTYVGLLFLANAAGALVAAYIISRTVGLPGAADLVEESFFEPMGLASLLVEALFVVVYAAGSARRTLTA